MMEHWNRATLSKVLTDLMWPDWRLKKQDNSSGTGPFLPGALELALEIELFLLFLTLCRQARIAPLPRHHSFHSTKVILVYLPSADKMAAEVQSRTIERVPSSAGLSDGGATDVTTDDERQELWSQSKT